MARGSTGRGDVILNVFIYPAGHHEAAWRHPLATPERIYDADYYQEIARTAEAAGFASVFFADSPSLRDTVEFNAAGRLDPLVLLTTIAAATERIGLIATASTTYTEPYNLARTLASIDHVSKGRVGWNIVTTDAAGAGPNFGISHPDNDTRYDRATEFTDAVLALWDSWDDDAIVLDRAAGRYADPDKVRRIDVHGRHISVRGPLNVPRPPQGWPVLVQAGASNRGRAFAARYAEVIFAAQQQLSDGQQFYSNIKSQVSASGRDPDGVRILPGISPFIGSTETEAIALQREFDELTVPAYGLHQLATITGTDLSHLDLDGPVPSELFADAGSIADNSRSRKQVVATIVERERPTVRQLLHRLAGARGHHVIAGTPEQVVDEIEAWFTQGAADGFNVMPPYLPGGLSVFIDEVVPILRRRGLFSGEYRGTTLREILGLVRPVDRSAGRAVHSG